MSEGEKAAKKAAEEKERRIEQLYAKSAKRMGNQGILRGWGAWREVYEDLVAKKQMLASAGARLLRPKLAASYAHWMREWAAHTEAARLRKQKGGHAAQLDDLEERRARLERELSTQKGDYEARLSAAADEAKVAISRLRAELGTCLLYTSPSPRD